ncbi:MAG: TerB family tellurite resistance protein [Polyangiaceae bacterium]|nr:TerB family tellurite resistance protein [Polyangiaceae bacterium]
MTPAEKNVVRSLIAVAWADGKMEGSESSVIEGLLCGFDATDEEERELLAYASTRRTLDRDVPLHELGREDRELLLANAALLTRSDGDVSESESQVLGELVKILGFTADEADAILESVEDGALALGSRVLQELPD